jgi:hypothetical protein
MAHLYVEPERRERPFWRQLGERWESLVAALLCRPSVDLVLLPRNESACEVRARQRGAALITKNGNRFAYHQETGDPLGIGHDLVNLDVDAAYEAAQPTDYPDAIVQIAMLALAPRSGDIILSAVRDWDFRGRYEPIPHVSSHGALHRDHMLVPLLLNRRPARAPRRTVDVMPSTLAALGLPLPAGLDGRSFL